MAERCAECRLFVILFCFLVLNATVHGKELQVDFDHCSHVKFGRKIVVTDELSIGSYELFGIVRSNIEDKTFHDLSSECINTLVETGDVFDIPGYCKYMAPDENYFVSKVSCDSSGCSWEIIYGTGKFKGATGSVSFKPFTQAKPISEDNYQGCSRHVGTIILPDTQ